MIPEEKAKELFLKYFRICNDFHQSKESGISFCNKFIEHNEDLEYWMETKNTLILIEE